MSAARRVHYTVGLIEGGVAPNVDLATRLGRAVLPERDQRRAVHGGVGVVKRWLRVEPVLDISEPARMHTLPGFETAVFPLPPTESVP
jgi:hypothetical protein